MRKLIIATRNKGKVNEIKSLLKGSDFEVLSMIEAGIDADVEEDGTSFEENSLKKARAIQKITGGLVLADDSGLEIDFLNNAPGIYTARFMGDAARDQERYTGILRLLEGIPDEYRKARFVCAASVVSEKGGITARGILEGKIAYSAAGMNGFGYDPIFWVPEYNKTLAELDNETKNSISHRGNAFRKIAGLLESMSGMGKI